MSNLVTYATCLVLVHCACSAPGDPISQRSTIPLRTQAPAPVTNPPAPPQPPPSAPATIPPETPRSPAPASPTTAREPPTDRREELRDEFNRPIPSGYVLMPDGSVVPKLDGWHCFRIFEKRRRGMVSAVSRCRRQRQQCQADRPKENRRRIVSQCHVRRRVYCFQLRKRAHEELQNRCTETEEECSELFLEETNYPYDTVKRCKELKLKIL